MKNSIKKTLSAVLAVIMIMTIGTVFACAEENTVSIEGFLVAPSQYTNMENYGVHIEKTINGQSSVVSLGNFGGYVVYKFSQPVKNSDKNACGIDFIVTGNAFAATASAQEPGQVWVSEDGESWYALAGSEHYENETIWNYSVTYQKNPEKETVCNYTDSLGDSGAVSTATAARYPDASIYTLADIPEDNLTLAGILLRKARTPSTANVIETKFGYVDSLKNPSGNTPVNPYADDYANNCRDGQFDISWAVDADGKPVYLDSISYVKVQTAVFINSGAFGEKSTEISAIRLPDSENTSVGKTAAPSYIKVGGTNLPISSGNKEITAYGIDGEFTVEVGSDANVYINNARGNKRSFDFTPEKGMVRVIVQSGNAEPLIYYITLSSEEAPEGYGEEGTTVPETPTEPTTEPSEPTQPEEPGEGENENPQPQKNGFFAKLSAFFHKVIAFIKGLFKK